MSAEGATRQQQCAVHWWQVGV